ncbi:MAG: hypothetical protein CMI15_12165 [Opitutaceae bacterium]|nr:hypothetical protein [Opitutaceae bacterium]
MVIVLESVELAENDMAASPIFKCLFSGVSIIEVLEVELDAPIDNKPLSKALSGILRPFRTIDCLECV